ncbi:MAG: MarC family protein [Actinobacteria bacterium]|nr:MAG: MarC family protein [Actinomycetota bacterium]
MNYLGFAVTVFAGFLAISNPIASTPVFLSITEGETDEIRKAIARRAVFVAFAIVAVLCIVGKTLFSVLGITLGALQLTGGAIAFIIGYRMLQGDASNVQSPKPSIVQTQDFSSSLDMAISPLAVPILVGPGTIATALSYAGHGGPAEIAITITAFAALCLVTYLLFIFGRPLVRYLGRTGIRALNRLMGLVLAVVGVQLLLNGAQSAFASLGG